MTTIEIIDVLTESIRYVSPELDLGRIDLGATLSDLGCSSIDRAEIVTIAMEQTGTDVPLSELHKGLTIGQLVDLLTAR